MDSVTQIVLGAAVGEAVLGGRVGRRATLWGAICGTLPDLDVLVPLGDAVSDFTYHRSASHSLLVLAVLTPLLVWLILKCHPGTRDLRGRWALLVYAVFATHVLLDAFTIYGTQLLWPLSDYPFGLGSVFIIDPAFTLPLAAGLLAVLWLGHARGARWNAMALAASTLYLGWSVAAQQHVERLAAAALREQGIGFAHLVATPAPFNTLLWRIVAVGDAGYHVAFRSLLEDEPRLVFEPRPSHPALLEGLESHWPVIRLKRFTKGFYSVEQVAGGVVISDLRMGLYPDYVFRFRVAESVNPHPRPERATRVPSRQDFARLPAVWRRIWDASVRI